MPRYIADSETIFRTHLNEDFTSDGEVIVGTRSEIVGATETTPHSWKRLVFALDNASQAFEKLAKEVEEMQNKDRRYKKNYLNTVRREFGPKCEWWNR